MFTGVPQHALQHPDCSGVQQEVVNTGGIAPGNGQVVILWGYHVTRATGCHAAAPWQQVQFRRGDRHGSHAWIFYVRRNVQGIRQDVAPSVWPSRSLWCHSMKMANVSNPEGMSWDSGIKYEKLMRCLCSYVCREHRTRMAFVSPCVWPIVLLLLWNESMKYIMRCYNYIRIK